MDYRLLLYLAVGTFTISTVGFVFSGVLPLIAADTHVAVAMAGLVIAAYSLAYAVGAPLLSALFGARERHHLLCGAMAVFVVGNLCAAASPYFYGIVAAQVLMGGAAGLFVSTAQATAVSLVEPHHRARAVALVFSGTTFAVALGAPMGSLIANLWGWRATFICVAAVGVVCVAVMWFLLPRGMRGSKLSLGERLAAVGRPGIPSSLLVTLLFMSGGFVIIAYLGPFSVQGAGLSDLALPAILLSFGLGAVIGNLAGGYITDRIGPLPVIAMTLGVSLFFSVALSLDVKYLPAAIAGPALIGMMFPWGVLAWTFPSAQTSRLAGLAPDAAHLTLSLNISAMYFGIALGTFAGGRVLEWGHVTDLGFAATIFPLLALLALQVSRRHAPVEVEAAAE